VRQSGPIKCPFSYYIYIKWIKNIYMYTCICNVLYICHRHTKSTVIHHTCKGRCRFVFSSVENKTTCIWIIRVNITKVKLQLHYKHRKTYSKKNIDVVLTIRLLCKVLLCTPVKLPSTNNCTFGMSMTNNMSFLCFYS
jgi:hypothetical protein